MILDETLRVFNILVFFFHQKPHKLKTASDFLSKDFLTGLNLKCFKNLIQERWTQIV